MHTVTSFPPIANPSAHTLILGSIPGVLSLQARQYYAHPRNAFWSIMGNVHGFDIELPYAARVEKLKASGLALWDVLQSCSRHGSLDSAIEEGSRVPNDFARFFAQHPHVRLVAFNGTEAEKSFNAYVLPKLNMRDMCFVRLPSTSPAHAARSLAQKTEAWRTALCLSPSPSPSNF